MVPENVFLQKWNSNTNDDIHERIKVLARMFRCSGSVIARRALDNKTIDKSVYDRVIADAIEAYIQAKKREVPVVIITELLVAN